MKNSDIQKQLLINVPLYTDRLTRSIDLLSLTYDSETVTAVCSEDHDLTTGQALTITGALFNTEIQSITNVNGTVTVVTVTDHDLTYGWQDTVTISGTTNYNGTHELTGVPNRRTFNFIVQDLYALETTGILQEDRYGFNGVFNITTVDDTTFTYEVSTILPSSAAGEFKAKAQPNISCLESEEILVGYLDKAKYISEVLLVILGSVDANQDVDLNLDVYSKRENSEEFNQILIENMSIYYVIPKNNNASSSGAITRDLAEDMRAILAKSVIGYTPENTIDNNSRGQITYVSDDIAFSNRAYYVHQYAFQRLSVVTSSDIFDEDRTRAFRDINLDLNDNDLTASINLDEEPYED